MLRELTAIPEGLLALPATALHQRLDGPTLIHLPGRNPEPLFVSVLLHGNEDSGWEAMRELLAHCQGRELPRALSLFIGNVTAARQGVRRLDGQHDYNRIWKGSGGAEHQMARQIIETMRRRRVFASIDIHNNTGLNPHYACINRQDHRFLHLALLFSRTVVYFTQPDAVQSMAFSALCPAVTVECGKVGQHHATAHARQLVEAALHLDHFPEHPVSAHDYDLFHTVATVKVPESVTFGFGDEGGELAFTPDLDHLNFRELPGGTLLARLHSEAARLQAWDESGRDVAERFFVRDNSGLKTRLPLMPSMLTLNAEVIRQDCLCYLMERLPAID
ncbi:MAG: M14 family metallopeptidase [Gammaproteobacteria bacterium]|nr:M14 family metallopeptidase [Gammaproteobacteria bacterium]